MTMKTKKAIVFSSKPVESTERMTIFNCRGCDACITGPATPIGPLSVGWALLRRVDGPNAVCPKCAADPEALLKVVHDDGHPDAALDVLVLTLTHAGHVVLRHTRETFLGHSRSRAAYFHVDGSFEREVWDDELLCDCPEDITWSRTIQGLFLDAFSAGFEAGMSHRDM